MKHFTMAIIVISAFGIHYVSGSECPGKILDNTLPLFEHAQECTQQLRSALTICQALRNCSTNLLFAQATHNAHHCRRILNDHVKTLADNPNSYPISEKNKTFDHHIALSELLATKEAHEVLSYFPIENSKKSCLPPFSH
jgi:hypothetical protein